MGLGKRLFVPQPSGVGFPSSAAANMLAHYKLDGNANDETGDYNGTESGTVLYTTGQFGQAHDGNGGVGNPVITLPNGSPFNDSDTIKAVSAWVKLDTTTSRVFPLSISSESNANQYWYFGWLADLGKIYVATRNGSSGNQSFATATVTANTNWHHIFCQVTATTREIWLDGISQTVTHSKAGSGTDTSWISYPNYSGTVTGAIGVLRMTSRVYSNGLIDQVRIYDRALTSSEISQLANE